MKTAEEAQQKSVQSSDPKLSQHSSLELIELYSSQYTECFGLVFQVSKHQTNKQNSSAETNDLTQQAFFGAYQSPPAPCIWEKVPKIRSKGDENTGKPAAKRLFFSPLLSYLEKKNGEPLRTTGVFLEVLQRCSLSQVMASRLSRRPSPGLCHQSLEHRCATIFEI